MAYAEKRGDGEYPWRVRWELPPDGSGKKKYNSASGFATEGDALDHGRKKEQEQEVDLRRGEWHDKRKGELTVNDYFWKMWLPAQSLSDKSRANREGEYRNHIGPRWGAGALNAIEMFDVMAFENQLRARRSASTAGNVMELLRMMLEDAVYAGLLKTMPMRPKRRRGKREPDKSRDGIVTTLETIAAIRARMTAPDALLVLVMAFTGVRWGEACGMRRGFLTLRPAVGGKPAGGVYAIDEEVGAVHEDPHTGRRYFGPPKGGRGRTVELPPFLAELLIAHLKTFPVGRDLLFTNTANGAYARTQFNGRWRRACDGWPARGAVQGHAALLEAVPVAAELVPHDLRHTHKTWLAEDGIEPVARDERLGHVTPGMDGIYIHATAAMRERILVALQKRWKDHIARSSPTPLPFEGS